MQLVSIAAVLFLAAFDGTGATVWPRLSRRTSVRAALANKMDPNFWPTRGRRASTETLQSPPAWHRHPMQEIILRRQTTDEEGPFWANRGRSIPEIETLFSPGSHLKQSTGSFWANRVRSIQDGDNSMDIATRQNEIQGPFWANRGRAAQEKERALGDEGPFWANRGRSTGEEEGPFWANRGRATSSEEGPFWANRGRSTASEEETIGAHLGRSPKMEGGSSGEGPFWANRGRSIDEAWPEQLRRDILYAEEPGWLSLRHNGGRRSIIAPDDHSANNEDTFWVARGKKQSRSKRELGPTEAYWVLRNRRDSKTRSVLDQLKEAQFWPSRGKKANNQLNYTSQKQQVDNVMDLLGETEKEMVDAVSNANGTAKCQNKTL